MMSVFTHCQICGRAIKTVYGFGHAHTADLIAHHGYKRRWGQQTASCFGARWRPYELAADAIPPAIASLEAQAQRWTDRLALIVAEPPASYNWYPTSRGIVMMREAVVLPRPEGFDSSRRPGAYTPKTYAQQYWTERGDLVRNLYLIAEDILALKQRLASWKPAAAAV